MNDAQTWTSIGGLLAVIIGFLGLMVRLFTMTLDGKFEALDHRFAALESRIDAKLEAGFARLERRIDGLDRDVTTLTRRFLDRE